MSEQQEISADSESERASAPRPAPFAVFPHKPSLSHPLTRVFENRSGGFYGRFDADALASQAAAFISSNSDGNEELLVQSMHNFLALAQKDCVALASTTEGSGVHVTHSCWLCIRMTLPTDDWFDEWFYPRWHTDGRMFDCTCPEPKVPHSKYAFTILGPSTRVMVPNPAVTAVLNMGSETGRAWDQNKPDPELAKKLAEYPEAAIETGQINRFSWNEHDSPVHSEPDSTKLHRVFVSVLFGREDELRDMCNIRDEEYGFWTE
jgi:hypothetical protein